LAFITSWIGVAQPPVARRANVLLIMPALYKS
jgi:hypothetical protein